MAVGEYGYKIINANSSHLHLVFLGPPKCGYCSGKWRRLHQKAKNRHNVPVSAAGPRLTPVLPNEGTAYFTCLPMSPAISNIDTWGLPNTSLSLASAFTIRLLAASCRLCSLM